MRYRFVGLRHEIYMLHLPKTLLKLNSNLNGADYTYFSSLQSSRLISFRHGFKEINKAAVFEAEILGVQYMYLKSVTDFSFISATF